MMAPRPSFVMELEGVDDSDKESDVSDSEYSESLGDEEDDDKSNGGYTSDCTSDSGSCNTFLDGIELDLKESYQRDESENAQIRASIAKRSASLSALDMLARAKATTPNNNHDGGARQNSLQAIMNRMQNTHNSYFQDPTAMASTATATAIATSTKRSNPRSLSSSALNVATLTIDYRISPEETLTLILQGVKYDSQTADDFFLQIDATRLNRYSACVAKAVRNQDLDQLRQLHESGVSFDACNTQGESLVHLACRRRNSDLLRFLIQEAQVALQVRDDWGKSPLHELCWNGRPKEGGKDFFGSVKLVLDKAPQLLFAKDKRSFVPLAYCPKDSWNEWNHFLTTNRVWIRCKVQFIGFIKSRDQLQQTLELAQAALKDFSGHQTSTRRRTGTASHVAHETSRLVVTTQSA